MKLYPSRSHFSYPQIVECLQGLEEELPCVPRGISKAVTSARMTGPTQGTSSLMKPLLMSKVSTAPLFPQECMNATSEAIQCRSTSLKKSHQKLLNDTARLLRKHKCWSCVVKDSTHLIVDCGHLALCEMCAGKRKYCIVCGSKATCVVHVFM